MTPNERQQLMRLFVEFVVDFVGCDEVAIYEPGEDGEFRLTISHGLEGLKLERFRLGEGPAGIALASGRTWVNPRPHIEDNEIAACVPLRIDNELIGAIIVFGRPQRAN